MNLQENRIEALDYPISALENERNHYSALILNGKERACQHYVDWQSGRTAQAGRHSAGDHPGHR